MLKEMHRSKEKRKLGEAFPKEMVLELGLQGQRELD